jgi:pimeloyl-ACP methyl ester carboxylesterase
MQTYFEPGDGLAMHVVGKGPPLLLVPYPMAAFVAGDRIVDALLHGVADLGFTCVTFDPPGSGQSARRKADCSMREMVDCILATLRAHGVQEPIPVLAHSQATLAALAFAAQHPDLVASLILAGASARSPRGFPGSLSHRTHPAFPGLAARLAVFRLTGRLAAQKHLYNYVLRHSFVNPSLAPEVPLSPGDWREPAQPRYRWLERGAQTILDNSRIRQPVLLITGAEDPLVPEPLTLELANSLANVQHCSVRNSGHYTFLEQGDVFWREVARFTRIPSKEVAKPSWST